MHQIRFRRSAGVLVLVSFVLLVTSPGFAERQKSVQNEAEFISFDEATSTVTVKITNKGKGNKKLIQEYRSTVKAGKEATFNVIPTGSVLKRTSVAINGQKAEMTDLQPGKTVNIYWVPDPNKEGDLFIRKIDVVMSEEEADRRYGVEEVE